MDRPADARPIDASIPPEIIEAFIAATVTAFQELTGTEVAAREPFLLGRHIVMDVTATVILRHEPPGRMDLMFPISVLKILSNRYLAGTANLTDELMDDAAGEFANVIAGQAKTMLKGTPEHFLLSTPVVVRSGSSALDQRSENIVTVYFDCDAGTFGLQVRHW